jgi:LPXTG-site transpeptidase (sortase) family protein
MLTHLIMKKRLSTFSIFTTGTLLLAVGLVLLISIIRSRESSIVASPLASPATHQAAAATKATVPPSAVQGNPVHLSIPSLNISLAVIPGIYNSNTQTWTLTTNKAQYATISPEPNDQSGDTFIYGHYRKEVFASLHTIKANAEAVVTTDNGHTFTYTLTDVRVVSPEDAAAVFNYKGGPMLTIQTCTGLFYQNRQLFDFTLEGAK